MFENLPGLVLTARLFLIKNDLLCCVLWVTLPSVLADIAVSLADGLYNEIKSGFSHILSKNFKTSFSSKNLMWLKPDKT